MANKTLTPPLEICDDLIARLVRKMRLEAYSEGRRERAFRSRFRHWWEIWK